METKPTLHEVLSQAIPNDQFMSVCGLDYGVYATIDALEWFDIAYTKSLSEVITELLKGIEDKEIVGLKIVRESDGKLILIHSKG